MRLFFKITLIVLLCATFLSIYAFWIEPNTIAVNTINIPNSGSDIKIVFMSDFQRADSDPTFVQRAVDIANAQKPDLVLLGGDYLEYYDFELPSVAPLKQLKARYGVYGVMGNHDYLALSLNRGINGCPNKDGLLFASHIKNFLQSDGAITILSNEQKEIGNITIIGLDDLWGCARNEAKAYSNQSTKPSNESNFLILLSHNQDQLTINTQHADMYLFGHTHCGQVRLPFIGSIPKFAGFKGEFDAGYYFVNGSHIYTTCGLAPAPHFLSPPEVTVIELSK